MTKLKRLLMLLGGKGGTGKTAFACALYQCLKNYGVSCVDYLPGAI